MTQKSPHTLVWNGGMGYLPVQKIKRDQSTCHRLKYTGREEGTVSSVRYLLEYGIERVTDLFLVVVFTFFFYFLFFSTSRDLMNFLPV